MIRFGFGVHTAVLCEVEGETAITPSGKRFWHADISQIVTALVRAADKHCEHYASDIWCDINNIVHRMEDRIVENAQFGIGFRDCGVDGSQFMECRLSAPEVYGENPYKEVMCVTMRPDVTAGKIHITLLRNPIMTIINDAGI